MADVKHIEYKGYKLDVDMDKFDDVEFLDLADQAMTRGGALIDIMKMAVGEDGYKDLKAYFVKKDGKLKISVLKDIFDLIFNEVSPKE